MENNVYDALYEEFLNNYSIKIKNIEERVIKEKGIKKLLLKIKISKFIQLLVKKWNRFSIFHPKSAKIIKQFLYFLLFSQGVTIFQYLVFTIMPYMLGLDLASKEFMWPQIILVKDFKYTINSTTYTKDIVYNILGYAVRRDPITQEVLIGGGLGYFISYEVGTFLAQVINFPLQRNITFKSKGNPWFQAMWYFIAWVIISLLCNAVNGLWMPFAEVYFPVAVYNILVTLITGSISMLIFFFVFKIIFPEEKKESSL